MKSSKVLYRGKEIIAGSFGNGLTVMVQGTENKLAHINSQQKITWYKKNLPTKVKEHIESIASDYQEF